MRRKKSSSSAMRIVLLVLCAAVTGGYLAYEPWRVYQKQKEQADQATAEMQRSEQEKGNLLREKMRLEGSVGREKLARERGFVKEGEVRLGPDGP